MALKSENEATTHDEVSDVNEVIARMLQAYGFGRQKQLTDRLGLAHTAVNRWRSRGNVAKSALLQCTSDTGVKIEYLLTGQGKKFQKLTKNEFRFVFQRIMSNAKLAGLLEAGENYSNDGMIAISDRIYDSITSDGFFDSLFEGSDAAL